MRLFCFSEKYIAYDAAWHWLQATAADLSAYGGPEALALLQHEPVYSFGRRVRPEHLLMSPEDLLSRGALVVESDRGGDVTFHGPGQIVCYPVLDLRRRRLGPSDYVRALEATVIKALESFGIVGCRVSGRPGVWTNGQKLAAIGVRVQGGITTHGFALNVETDLSWFDAIVPCGLFDASMTSIREVLGFNPGIASVEEAIRDAFANVFDSILVPAIAEPAKEPVLSHGR